LGKKEERGNNGEKKLKKKCFGKEIKEKPAL